MRAIGVFLIGCSCLAVNLGVATRENGQVDALAEGKEPAKAEARVKEEGRESRVEMRVERKPIPPQVVYEFSRTVGQGRLVKKSDGKPGEVVRNYAVRFQNGRPVSKELVSENRTESEPVLFLMGRAGYPSSRHQWLRGRVMEMSATAYDPSAGRGKRATFRCATGLPAGYGKVAVDPRVIRLGSRLYVEGYGFAIAADTGGAIKGNKIDLGLATYREAMRFGRRKVRVHVLK